MNKIYKVVWCKRSHTWIAVSELASNKTKVQSSSQVYYKKELKLLDLLDYKTGKFRFKHIYLSIICVCGFNAPLFTFASGGVGGGSVLLASTNTAIASANCPTELNNKPYHPASVSGPNTYNSIAIGCGNTVFNLSKDLQQVIDHRGDSKPLQYPSGDASIAAAGVALGVANSVTKGGGVALGSNNQVEGSHYAVSIGQGNKSSDAFSIALGVANLAKNTSSIAIGTTNKAEGHVAIALGRQNHALGDRSVAIGYIATASNESSIALGDASNALAKHTIAIGKAVNARANDSIAIGYMASTGKDATSSLAVGAYTFTQGQFSVVIGHQSIATKHNTTVLGGRSAQASGVGATAIGSGVIANGEEATAIGAGFGSITSPNRTLAQGDQSVALGTASKAKRKFSVAIGGATSKGERAIAIGENAQSLEEKSIAIGASAIAHLKNSIALGANSETVKPSDKAYMTQKEVTETEGVLSIGNSKQQRRIQFVADGAADQDAVTVKQLKQSQENLKTILGLSAVDRHGNITTENIAGTGKKTLDEAIRANKTKIVGTNVEVTSLVTEDGSTEYKISANTIGVRQGTELKAQLGANAKDTISYVDGKNTKIQINQTTPNNTNVTFNLADDINLGSKGQITIGSSLLNNQGLSIQGGPSVTQAGLSAGQKIISQVAAGVQATDAVNVSQLRTATQAVSSEVLAGTNTRVSISQGDKGQTQYTVNADGTRVSSSSALTVSKSKADEQNITDYQIDLAQSTKDALRQGQQAHQTVQDKGLTFAGTQGNTGVKKLGERVEITGANKNITTVADSTGLKIQLSNQLDLSALGSLSIGSSLLNNQGLSIQGGPSVTQAGLSAGQKIISQVAAGVQATDAVNVSQLRTATQAVSSEVLAGTNTRVSISQGDKGQTQYTVNVDGTRVSSSSALTVSKSKADEQNITDYQIDLAQSTKDALRQGQQAHQTVQEGLTFAGTQGNTGAKKLGERVEIMGANKNITTVADSTGLKIQLSNQLDLSALGSLSIGSSLLNNQGLSIQGGPSVTQAGLSAGQKIISQVAAGVQATDAVNVSQLRTATQAVSSEVLAGTNTRVSISQGDKGQTQYTVNADGTRVSSSSALTVSKSKADEQNITDYQIDLAQNTKDALRQGQQAHQTVQDKGLTFAGTQGNTGAKKLGERVEIMGANKNITTVADSTGLKIQLSNQLDLSALGSLSIGNLSLRHNLIQLGRTEFKDGSITGLSNRRIDHPDFAQRGRAATEEQLQLLAERTSSVGQGWNLASNNSLRTRDEGNLVATPIKAGDTVDIGLGRDEKNLIVTTKQERDVITGKMVTTIDFGLNQQLDLTEQGKLSIGNINVINNSIKIGETNIQSGSIQGLLNTTWNPESIQANRAATEGQLQQAIAHVHQQVSQRSNEGIQYDKTDDGLVNTQKVTLAGGAKGTLVTNLAEGQLSENSKDAVTGHQLWSVQQQVDLHTNQMQHIQTQMKEGQIGLLQQINDTGEIVIANQNNGTVVNVKGRDGDRKITSIAAGLQQSDAVNVGQLNTTNNEISQLLGGGASYDATTQKIKAPTYEVASQRHHNVGNAIHALNTVDQALEQKINHLGHQLNQVLHVTNQKIDQVSRRANAGIAAAMALEAAPHVAGKYSYAAGAAYHGGENAVGITFRKTSDNGHWSFTGGVAAASEGDPSVRIGVSGVID